MAMPLFVSWNVKVQLLVNAQFLPGQKPFAALCLYVVAAVFHDGGVVHLVVQLV